MLFPSATLVCPDRHLCMSKAHRRSAPVERWSYRRSRHEGSDFQRPTTHARTPRDELEGLAESRRMICDLRSDQCEAATLDCVEQARDRNDQSAHDVLDRRALLLA